MRFTAPVPECPTIAGQTIKYCKYVQYLSMCLCCRIGPLPGVEDRHSTYGTAYEARVASLPAPAPAILPNTAPEVSPVPPG